MRRDIALSRQTVNRILKHLETNGTIALKHRRIEIVDVAALMKAMRIDEPRPMRAAAFPQPFNARRAHAPRHWR
ncbi:helix-turn-helix domain-containing protein [Sphingomonas liriopis]|uniref:helix-turn-helix domain-containing protein n=1 Tax=Sphingomonas liriopis TaxID=2949094 RepID=UPI003BF5BB23